jgi:regulator of protease activity HflC (stomatin/prohibitin superfamily)
VRGEQIVAQAQGEAERLLEEAQRQADAKRLEGERLAAEQMDEADRYALEMLRKLQQQLDAFMSSVQSGISTLEQTPEHAHLANEAPAEQTA